MGCRVPLRSLVRCMQSVPPRVRRACNAAPRQALHLDRYRGSGRCRRRPGCRKLPDSIDPAREHGRFFWHCPTRAAAGKSPGARISGKNRHRAACRSAKLRGTPSLAAGMQSADQVGRVLAKIGQAGDQVPTPVATWFEMLRLVEPRAYAGVVALAAGLVIFESTNAPATSATPTIESCRWLSPSSPPPGNAIIIPPRNIRRRDSHPAR